MPRAKEFEPEFKPYIVSAIEESLYLDDFFISIPNTEIGIKIKKDIKTLLLGTELHITNWFSSR